MSLTDDDWKRIRNALAFRSTKLYEQGAGSAFREFRNSCYAEACRHDEIIQKVRDFHRATGWRPIETAPMDGTRILAWHWHWSKQEEVIARWSDDQWQDAWSELTIHPTYWMPLPEPPRDNSLAATPIVEAETSGSEAGTK